MTNISLFYGEEDFLLNEEIRKRKAGLSEFNYEHIDGSSADISALIFSLSSMPMLGSSRLVLIEALEYAEEDEEKLFNALKNIDQSVKAIFVNYGSVDKRRKFYKLIEKIGEVREFRGFSEWEQDKALAWLVGRVKHHGKKIDGRAANALIEIVGTNLRMLDKEIEKIATYIGERELIREQDAFDLASSGEIDAFEFSNAIRNKDTANAMSCLNKLFKDNNDPHMLIGMLAKLYRMLIQVKHLEERGMGEYEIAKELKAKPFFVKKCMEKTKSFSIKELAGNIKSLHLADLKMKSGSSSRLTMEMLIPELCNE